MSRGADVANLEGLDQDNHESWALTEGAESEKEWKACLKNPKHEGFIPAPEFSINNLPVGYRHDQLFEYIKYLAQVTVKVVVNYTSIHRPDDYPFSSYRGTRKPHNGSGCVVWVNAPRERKELGKTCPCGYCKKTGQPEKKWWECFVITAQHVVFNDEEAEDTVIDVFYDEKLRRGVNYLYGVNVIEANTDGDRCQFRCVTHDKKVFAQLRHAVHMCTSLHSTFSMGGYPTLGKENANLCVVVSHPHGCSKHVTIGHWTECLMQGEDSVFDEHASAPRYETCLAYQYDTPTCTGSSGGPVLILGLWNNHWSYILTSYYFCHTHRLGDEHKNENTSSYWIVSAS